MRNRAPEQPSAHGDERAAARCTVNVRRLPCRHAPRMRFAYPGYVRVATYNIQISTRSFR